VKRQQISSKQIASNKLFYQDEAECYEIGNASTRDASISNLMFAACSNAPGGSSVSNQSTLPLSTASSKKFLRCSSGEKHGTGNS
jgi:hypothetical protein